MFKLTRASSPRLIYGATARLLGPGPSEAFWERFRERFIAADDIRFIRSLGFDTVRVPLHWGLFMTGTEPPLFEGPGWHLLDRLIGWCRDQGLRVILDLHAAPGGQTGIGHDDGTGYPLLFYVARYQRLTIELWRRLARHYRDEPVVLGYDLLNEPIAPYHDTLVLNPRLEPLYRRIVAAIRAEDDRHVIFLGGAQWSGNFAVFGRPFDDNVVYTYHKFWAPTERMTIRTYIDFANTWAVPIFLGESGEYTDTWTRAFRDLHDRHRIGWSFWSYKNLDTDSSVVSIRRPADWDRVISAMDRPALKGDRGLGPVAIAEETEGQRLEDPGAGPGGERPDPRDDGAVARALDAFLDNIELARCHVNVGYVEALGFDPASVPSPPFPRAPGDPEPQ
jgi:hypothetical protein